MDDLSELVKGISHFGPVADGQLAEKTSLSHCSCLEHLLAGPQLLLMSALELSAVQT